MHSISGGPWSQKKRTRQATLLQILHFLSRFYFLPRSRARPSARSLARSPACLVPVQDLPPASVFIESIEQCKRSFCKYGIFYHTFIFSATPARSLARPPPHCYFLENFPASFLFSAPIVPRSRGSPQHRPAVHLQDSCPVYKEQMAQHGSALTLARLSHECYSISACQDATVMNQRRLLNAIYVF